MSDREAAIKLAKSDSGAALAAARAIDDPWYRCQALAWVARFAPESEWLRIVKSALQSAAAADDRYKNVAAAAWPIRALVERSALTDAQAALRDVLPLAAEIEHIGSRAEALLLLLQAVLPASNSLRKPVFHAILDLPHEPVHWRRRRTIREAFLMVHAREPALVAVCLPRVRDQKLRSAIESRLAAGETREPRAFFW